MWANDSWPLTSSPCAALVFPVSLSDSNHGPPFPRYLAFVLRRRERVPGRQRVYTLTFTFGVSTRTLWKEDLVQGQGVWVGESVHVGQGSEWWAARFL